MGSLRKSLAGYQAATVPAHPDVELGHPLVVFGDHGFCAGRSEQVQRMPGPHMHSQVEFNLVVHGQMTYWFDGKLLSVGEGRLVLFWGMAPHQVIDCAENTRFVVLYVPMSVFLRLPDLAGLRNAIFSGAFIESVMRKPYDLEMFTSWRADLLSGDTQRASIVQDELTARVRRLNIEGWRDLRQVVRPAAAGGGERDRDSYVHVERMARYIGDHALDDIAVGDVARAAGLHPNYAIMLFKRLLGLSIKQSITRHRLDAAQSMMVSTDLSVAAIAFDCGFGSLSSFYEAFERRFKMTPTAFRKSLTVPIAR